jgi:hypothetical protein
MTGVCDQHSMALAATVIVKEKRINKLRVAKQHKSKLDRHTRKSIFVTPNSRATYIIRRVLRLHRKATPR